MVAPVTPAGAPPAIGLTPRQIVDLAVGAESRVRLTFKVEPGAVRQSEKIVLRLAGEDPDGVSRTQRLVLVWTPPAATPPASEPAFGKPAHAEIGAAALAAAAAAAAAGARRRPTKALQPAKPQEPSPSPEPASGTARDPVPPQRLPEEPSPIGMPEKQPVP
jgi:hypothetical protein